MSRFAYISAITLSLAIAAPVLAQSTSNAPDGGTGVATTPQTPGMAGTSSDSGNMSTGASSAAIGTGNTDKQGTMAPQVPAHTSTGNTGANPNVPGANTAP